MDLRSGGRYGLAVGAGFGSGDGGDVRRAKFEAEHCQCSRAFFDEKLGQIDAAKILHFDQVLLRVHTRKLCFDFLDERTNGYPARGIDADHSPVFLVACNTLADHIGSGPILDEQFVPQRHFYILTGDAQAFKAAVFGNDVRLGIADLVHGSQPRNDAIGRDRAKDVQAFDHRARMSHVGAAGIADAALAGNMCVRMLELNIVEKSEILDRGLRVPANGGQGGRGLRGNNAPGGMAKFATERVTFRVKVKRYALLSHGDTSAFRKISETGVTSYRAIARMQR